MEQSKAVVSGTAQTESPIENQILSTVSCETVIPKTPKLQDDVLTVGRHFYLNCHGDWDKTFDLSQAQFKLDEKHQNFLKLFNVEARDDKNFDINMTVYLAGEMEFPELIITDGKGQISLGKQSFKTESVLPKPDPQKPEQPKPYGYAVGLLHLPMSYVFIAAAILFIIIARALAVAFQKQKWNRLKEGVKTFESVVPPDEQFYKTIRTLEKSEYPFADIEKAAKIYMLRTFEVPLFDLNTNESMTFMKRKYPHLKDIRNQMYHVLKNIESLKKMKDLSFEQKNKFVKQFYIFIERCEKVKDSRGLS
ncbi:MAG: hypothetical protein ACK41T_06335 [Pseudobdellovibrio sp.]